MNLSSRIAAFELFSICGKDGPHKSPFGDPRRNWWQFGRNRQLLRRCALERGVTDFVQCFLCSWCFWGFRFPASGFRDTGCIPIRAAAQPCSGPICILFGAAQKWGSSVVMLLFGQELANSYGILTQAVGKGLFVRHRVLARNRPQPSAHDPSGLYRRLSSKSDFRSIFPYRVWGTPTQGSDRLVALCISCGRRSALTCHTRRLLKECHTKGSQKCLFKPSHAKTAL